MRRVRRACPVLKPAVRSPTISSAPAVQQSLTSVRLKMYAVRRQRGVLMSRCRKPWLQRSSMPVSLPWHCPAVLASHPVVARRPAVLPPTLPRDRREPPASGSRLSPEYWSSRTGLFWAGRVSSRTALSLLPATVSSAGEPQSMLHWIQSLAKRAQCRKEGCGVEVSSSSPAWAAPKINLVPVWEGQQGWRYRPGFT